MSKALCLFGLVVAALVLLVFGLDLAAGVPFKGVNKTLDICFVVATAALGYMSWESYRELA